MSVLLNIAILVSDCISLFWSLSLCLIQNTHFLDSFLSSSGSPYFNPGRVSAQKLGVCTHFKDCCKTNTEQKLVDGLYSDAVVTLFRLTKRSLSFLALTPPSEQG